MREPVGLLDTGPLVSFLASGLEHHEWATEEWKRLRPPLLTCEPVLFMQGKSRISRSLTSWASFSLRPHPEQTGFLLPRLRRI